MNNSTAIVITSIASAIGELVKAGQLIIAAAKQKAELTPEQEKAFQDQLSSAFNSPSWKIEIDPS